jgi:hypothetical protein
LTMLRPVLGCILLAQNSPELAGSGRWIGSRCGTGSRADGGAR